MELLRKSACVFLSILLGAALLKGAGVMFENAFSFPENVSRFLIMLIVFMALVQWSLKLTSRKK